MRAFSATLGLRPAVSEAGDKDVAGAVTAALAALADVQGLPVTTGTMVSADVLTQAGETQTAIDAIGTEFGSSTGLQVFIDETGDPTQADVIAALEAVIAQIRSSTLFTEEYYS
jgi:hypothetical protein